MIFLLPIGLLALLTLPIILLLHLMRERRRRVVVPSLMHWLNVPRRRDAQRVAAPQEPGLGGRSTVRSSFALDVGRLG